MSSFRASCMLFRPSTISFSSRSLWRQNTVIARRRLSDQQSSTLRGQEESSADQLSSEEAPASSSSEDSQSELMARFQAKEHEVTDLTGRLRYLQADYLNLQRNAAREKEQTRDFAITRFASDLLETVDVLSLALKSVPNSALSTSQTSSAASESAPLVDNLGSQSPPEHSSAPTKSTQTYLDELYTGVEMTHRLLLQTLFKYGVKPFDPTGDVFDPNRHEALYQAPAPGKVSGTIIDCQKLGYLIKDRTLRAAQVGVASESNS